jgi:hypothetical protein
MSDERREHTAPMSRLQTVSEDLSCGSLQYPLGMDRVAGPVAQPLRQVAGQHA